MPAKPSCTVHAASSGIPLQAPKKGSHAKAAVDRLTVDVKCDQTANVTLKAVLTIHQKHGASTVRLAPVSGSVKDGASTAFALKLTNSVLAALRAARKVSATVSINATSSNGTATASTSTVLHGVG
jgi:hypothetical protein